MSEPRRAGCEGSMLMLAVIAVVRATQFTVIASCSLIALLSMGDFMNIVRVKQSCCVRSLRM